MNFNTFNRRTHLYLGMALFPWVLMYGLSSLVINHGPFFNKISKEGMPQWTIKTEQPYHRPVPEKADLQMVATEIMDDFGLRASFFVSRPTPERLNIHVRNFLSSTRLIYFIDEERLLVEELPMQWRNFLIGMHLRGGYGQDLFLDDLWAVMLDLVCLAFLIWVISGIIMWWKFHHLRFWGAVALIGGLATFGWFLLAL